MKKFMPDRAKANELENTITSIVADLSEDGVAELDILRDSYGMLE
jgi:hypothetical protein